MPPGYVWVAGEVVKDPNLRVQEAIQLVFRKFRETWSIRKTFRWFRDPNIELPVNRPHSGKLVVVFQPPRPSFVASVLHNAFYAGAYCWGRRPTEAVWQEGRLSKRQASTRPAEDARVFIRDPCFDRMLFRGYLPIMSGWQMAQFFNSSGIRFRELKAFLVDHAERVKRHAVELAQHQKRPFQYLQEKVRKEELAREIAARDQIQED